MIRSVQFSCSLLSDSWQPHDCSTSGLPVHQLLGPAQTHVHQVGDVILCHPLPLLPSIFPSEGSFQMSQLFAPGGQSTGTSASASVLPMNIQNLFSLGLTGLNSCGPRDSQESFPSPQFKSINSSVLSFLYSPTLTSINDFWKNHSFDSLDCLT